MRDKFVHGVFSEKARSGIDTMQTPYNDITILGQVRAKMKRDCYALLMDDDKLT